MVMLRFNPSAVAAARLGVKQAAFSVALPPSPVDPAAGVHRAAQAISPTILPEPDHSSKPVPGALARILNLLIEGFAAYGASMHPGF
jgi:hypothetical protein